MNLEMGSLYVVVKLVGTDDIARKYIVKADAIYYTHLEDEILLDGMEELSLTTKPDHLSKEQYEGLLKRQVRVASREAVLYENERRMALEKLLLPLELDPNTPDPQQQAMIVRRREDIALVIPFLTKEERAKAQEWLSTNWHYNS